MELPQIDPLRAAVESVLLVIDTPVTPMDLARALDVEPEAIREVLAQMRDEFEARGSGFDLREVEGGWRLYTRAAYSDAVEAFLLDGTQTKLSRAAMETLAVVAYRQPATRDDAAGDERIGIGDPSARTEAIWEKDWDIKPYLYKVYETLPPIGLTRDLPDDGPPALESLAATGAEAAGGVPDRALLARLDRLTNGRLDRTWTTRDGGVLWLNGDVVFDPAVLEAALPSVVADESFVCVDTSTVADEEVKYTLDADGCIAELSKTVVGGLGEAVGINYVSAADKPVLIEHLAACAPQDYFERGMETAIADEGVRFRPLDISRFPAVEVDFEADLERGWDKARGTSSAAWHDVKDAARDAWEHVRGHGGAGGSGTVTETTVIRPR